MAFQLTDVAVVARLVTLLAVAVKVPALSAACPAMRRFTVLVLSAVLVVNCTLALVIVAPWGIVMLLKRKPNGSPFP